MAGCLADWPDPGVHEARSEIRSSRRCLGRTRPPARSLRTYLSSLLLFFFFSPLRLCRVFSTDSKIAKPRVPFSSAVSREDGGGDGYTAYLWRNLASDPRVRRARAQSMTSRERRRRCALHTPYAVHLHLHLQPYYYHYKPGLASAAFIVSPPRLSRCSCLRRFSTPF